MRGGPFELLIEGDGIPSPQCDLGQICVDGECLYPAFIGDGGVDAGDSDTDGDADTDTGDTPDSGPACQGGDCGADGSCGCSAPGRVPASRAPLFAIVVAAI
jgi:hypothetical protein